VTNLPSSIFQGSSPKGMGANNKGGQEDRWGGGVGEEIFGGC